MKMLSLAFLFTVGLTGNSYVHQRQNPDTVLQYYASASASTVGLSSALREISGLAVSTDNRLFGHNDEWGVIYQIDPQKGTVVKFFTLGDKPIRKDFEGMAIAGDRFFLVASDGTVYECSEGNHRESVAYKIHKTHLSGKYDVEGLCYDPDTHFLLLACKENPGQHHDNAKAIYSFSLETMKLEDKPRFLLRSTAIKTLLGETLFRPTGIARHPVSGSFFVLSSDGPWIIEVSPSGKLLGSLRLSRAKHPQAEGIAIGNDLTMYIADEGYFRGRLSRYHMSHKR